MMAPIYTATPEHVADAMRILRSTNAESMKRIIELEAELTQARRWAAAWKRAATKWRNNWTVADEFWMYECAVNQRKGAEIKRLRGLLAQVNEWPYYPEQWKDVLHEALKEPTDE